MVNGSAPSVGDCKNIIGSLLIALGELNGSAPPIDARCAFRAVERLRPARRGLQDLVGKLNGYILEVERLRPARKGLQEEAMARKVGVSLR